ncbi:MAG TPA: hydroxyacid dehydrogenase [Opitutaceae bacterium]|nr:hydroxyacid dehydrogenase [Opitutaceae bacterium]
MLSQDDFRTSRPTGIFLLKKGYWKALYGETTSQAIDQRVSLLANPDDLDEGPSAPEGLADAQIIFAGWSTPVMDETFLASAPNLQTVFYAGGSVRPFATEAFWERGIRVTTAYAVNAIPVSEYVLGAILLSLKHSFQISTGMRAVRGVSDLPVIPGAYGSTVGLVSLGAVGRRLCKLLRSFDVTVIAYDPFISIREAEDLCVELTSLDELFARADVISLHTPLTAATEGLISGRHFDAMKSGVTFINTARGAVVRENEMIAVLQRRPDLQVILDVTCQEPPETSSPLYNLPNVFLTPHIAGSVGTERLRLGKCMLEELDRYLSGRPLLWEITRERATIMA